MNPNRGGAIRPPGGDPTAVSVLVGGILGMVVAMGIGRFAFTPILPLMQRDLGVSNTVAGWLAGMNYLGYLAGAVACTAAPRLLRSRAVAAGALATSIATTAAMGWTVSPVPWAALRFAGGVASAVLFVVIASEVGETLRRRGHEHWIGTLYGGIGLGIALSGFAVPGLDRLGGWSGSWVGIGAVAAVLAAIGAALGRRHAAEPDFCALPLAAHGDLRRIRVLSAAYFLEGLGYVVTGTFLVAIVAATPGLGSFAPYTWVAVGLAAIPSTVLWPLVARRFGMRPALVAAYAVQAAGILVSRDADSVGDALFAAFTFGGTFLGIVALALGEGRRRLGRDGGRAAAFLTAWFGLGQVLGPPLAGMLADRFGGFGVPLLLAAGCVTLGGTLVALDRGFRLRAA